MLPTWWKRGRRLIDRVVRDSARILECECDSLDDGRASSVPGSTAGRVEDGLPGWLYAGPLQAIVGAVNLRGGGRG